MLQPLVLYAWIISGAVAGAANGDMMKYDLVS